MTVKSETNRSPARGIVLPDGMGPAFTSTTLFCDAAQLNLTAVVPRSAVIAECLRNASTPSGSADHRIAIIRDDVGDGHDAEICLLHGHTLIQDLAIRLPGSVDQWPTILAGNIRRLLSGTVADESVQLSQIHLIGDFPEQLDEPLSSNSGTTVVRTDLHKLVRMRDLSIGHPHPTTTLLASAISECQSINFLAAEHKRTAATRKSRKVRQLLVACVAILIGLFGVNQFQKSKHEEAVADLVRQQRQVEQQVVQAQSDVRLVESIDRWRKVDASNCLVDFLNLVPPTAQARLTGLEMSVIPNSAGLSIRANGIAEQQETFWGSTIVYWRAPTIAFSHTASNRCIRVMGKRIGSQPRSRYHGRR